jgi:hypothetical protein
MKFLVLGPRYSTSDILIREANDCEPYLVNFADNRARDTWSLPEKIIVNALQRSSEDIDDASCTLSIRCPGHIVLIQQSVVLVALLS